MQRLFLPRLTFGKSGKRCQTSARIVGSQLIWQVILNWWFLGDWQYFTLVIGYSRQNTKNISIKIGKIMLRVITHANEWSLVKRCLISQQKFKFCRLSLLAVQDWGGGQFSGLLWPPNIYHLRNHKIVISVVINIHKLRATRIILHMQPFLLQRKPRVKLSALKLRW